MALSGEDVERFPRRYPARSMTVARHSDTPETQSIRTLRVGEQVSHVLSEILARGDVHDETLAQHMVSITEVRLSPDLRHAPVLVKPLPGKDEEAVLNARRHHTAYLHR